MRIVFVLAIACATPAAAEPLHLVCLGAGSANRAATATAFANNSEGQSSWAQVTGNRSVPFEDQVNVEMDGDTGKIRMPRSMLPLIRGGENGWFELRKARVRAYGLRLPTHSHMRR